MIEILPVEACGAIFYIAADTLRRSTICPHLFGSELAVRIWDRESRLGTGVTPETIDASIKEQFGSEVPHPDDVVELDGQGGTIDKPELRFDAIPMLANYWQLDCCECSECNADDVQHCGCGPVSVTKSSEAGSDDFGVYMVDEARTVCRKHGADWWGA